MKYNIIGDVHSRKSWKDVVVPDMTNVFVGDYFAPYDYIPFEEQRNVFLDIMKFKEEHPETILLVGNHDEDHWHIVEKYSRFDMWHLKAIQELFEDYSDYFQAAASLDNKALVTHAGVSICWYYKYTHMLTAPFFINLDDKQSIHTDLSHIHSVEAAVKHVYEKEEGFIGHVPEDTDVYKFQSKSYSYKDGNFIRIDKDPDFYAEFINACWEEGKYYMFDFGHNARKMGDCYGTSDTQGPMWIRPNTLIDCNALCDDYSQIVGHTWFEVPEYNNGILFTDCLGTTTASAIFDPETKEMEVHYA